MRKICPALLCAALFVSLLAGCSNGPGEMGRISHANPASDAIVGPDDGTMGMGDGDMGMCDMSRCTCPDHGACGMMNMNCVPGCPGCGGDGGCDGQHDGGMGGCDPDSCQGGSGGHMEQMDQGGDGGHEGGHMGH